MSDDYNADRRAQLLKQTAKDYSAYLQVDATPEVSNFRCCSR